MTEFSEKNLLENKDMVFKNGTKIIHAAAYNGERMVYNNVIVLCFYMQKWMIRQIIKHQSIKVLGFFLVFKVSSIASFLKLLFMQKWMMREIHKSAKHKIIRFLFSFQVRVIFKYTNSNTCCWKLRLDILTFKLEKKTEIAFY